MGCLSGEACYPTFFDDGPWFARARERAPPSHHITPPPTTLVTMSVKDVQAIQDKVAGYWTDVRWVESTGSTNADLLKDGSAPGTVLIADEQTAGKGRLGRHWVSPKGSQLAMSMVIDVTDTPPPFGLLSIAPGVAVTDVVPQAQLKWPNDVQIGGKKIAGILSA